LLNGIEAAIQKRYRDRKTYAKKDFLRVGGYDDVEGAKTKPPEGMTEENWRRTCDHFCTDEHLTRSSTNKNNRDKQIYTNRGGRHHIVVIVLRR